MHPCICGMRGVDGIGKHEHPLAPVPGADKAHEKILIRQSQGGALSRSRREITLKIRQTQGIRQHFNTFCGHALQDQPLPQIGGNREQAQGPAREQPAGAGLEAQVHVPKERKAPPLTAADQCQRPVFLAEAADNPVRLHPADSSTQGTDAAGIGAVAEDPEMPGHRRSLQRLRDPSLRMHQTMHLRPLLGKGTTQGDHVRLRTTAAGVGAHPEQTRGRGQ